MRDIKATEELSIPEGVEVNIKSRIVTVTGPRGSLTKNIRHVNMDVLVTKNRVTLACWQGGRKQNATLRTIRSIINNMVIGVTKGFRYKMRMAYAHFPINCIPDDDAKGLKIANFLGEKATRYVPMLEGVSVSLSSVKDELVLDGIDVQNVSQSAASIHTSCLVKNKDIRKFLDGIYVSEKTNIEIES